MINNKNVMKMKFINAFTAMLLFAMLPGCQSKTGDNGGKEPAEAPAAPEAKAPAAKETISEAAQRIPPDAYAPDGLDGATVTIRPVGKAVISIVNGYPVRILEEAGTGAYRQARLMPGDHILHVGMIDARQGLNLKFKAKDGDYFALALHYAVDGELFWTPVIVSGAPNGPITADKDGLLAGKTQAEAVKLLTAYQSAPAAAQQAEAKAKKAEEEAQAKKAGQEAATKATALFEKAMKAHEAGRMEEAVQAVDEALMIAPSFDSALVLRGVVLARLKKPKPALESLDKGIRIARNIRGADDEWLHWPWFEKGMILIAARQPDQAHEAFSESIRVKPTAKAVLARANLAFAQGQAAGQQRRLGRRGAVLQTRPDGRGNGHRTRTEIGQILAHQNRHPYHAERA